MIDCIKIANTTKDNLKKLVSSDTGLAIIHVGDDVGSKFYVDAKVRDCNELGIPVTLFRDLESKITQEELEELVDRYNYDDKIKGIVIQSPLPKKYDEEKLVNMVSDLKDIDGFKLTSKYIPATPKGVMTILDSLGIDLAGKKVCLVGKGKKTNMPLIPLLLERGATLTVCHSRTDRFDLEDVVFMSDIIISAVGKPNTITAKMLGLNANKCRENNFKQTTRIIIDVGISRDENGKQIGDCEKALHEIVENITPYTNGVGLMTRVSLLQNLLEE